MASFNTLPRSLRAYILAHLILAVPCVALLAWQPVPNNWRLVAALLLFTVLFSTWKLELTIFQARMTPVFATVCMAMLLQGLTAAVLCSAVGAILTAFIRPKDGWKIKFLRPRGYHLGFNLANTTVAALLAGFAFNLAMTVSPKVGIEGLFAVAAFATVYFLVNTWGVAIAVALQQQLPLAEMWRQNFVWTAPGFYASAGAGLVIHSQYQLMGGWALVFLPPVYLIYHSYRVYTERIN